MFYWSSFQVLWHQTNQKHASISAFKNILQTKKSDRRDKNIKASELKLFPEAD